METYLPIFIFWLWLNHSLLWLATITCQIVLTEIFSGKKFATIETADFVVLKSVCLSTLTNHSNIGPTNGMCLGRVYLIVQPIMIDVQLPNKSYFTFEG